VAILWLAAPAAAQRTVVSGTVTDVNGIPWAGGTVEVTLSLPLGVSGATLNGVQIGGATQRVTLDGTGSFLMQLPDNAIVLPGGTQWTFAVNISPGVLPPLGTGPQTCTATLTITGASQSVTSSLNSCPKLSNVNGGIASETNAKGFFDMADPKYGGFFDVQLAFSSNTTITITNGQPTVVVASGPFVPGDVGKDIFVTSGCCGTSNNITGAVVLPKTTILSYQSATQVTAAANATGACNATGLAGGCIVAWGHNDDAAITAAETAWAGSTNKKCTTLQWPSAMFFISQPHWNTHSSACTGTEPAVSFTSTVKGYGPGVSLAVMEPNFSLTACLFGPNTNGCFFGIVEVIVEELGLYGAGNAAVSAPAQAVTLVNPGIGSQFFDINVTGFGGNAALAGFPLYGFNLNSSRVTFLDCDGFGKDCVVDLSGNNANSVCLYCFGGDNAGRALFVNPSIANHRFIDIGGDWGVTTGTKLIEVAQGDYVGEGSHGFNGTGVASLTGNNGSAIFTGTNATAQVHLTDAVFDNSACGAACNGVALQLSGNTLFAGGSTLKGVGAGGGINSVAGTKYFDECGNTITPAAVSGSVFGSCSITGTAQVAGNIVPSACGTSTVGSVSGAGGSGQFTLTFAGTPGTTCTVTVTFPTPFLATPICTFVDVGGTNAFPTAIVNGTVNTTSAAFTETGTTLTNGNTEVTQYYCRIP